MRIVYVDSKTRIWFHRFVIFDNNNTVTMIIGMTNEYDYYAHVF